MIKAKTPIISIVQDQDVFFIDRGAAPGDETLCRTSLPSLLQEENPADTLLKDLRGRKNMLLVIPDYWIGQAVYRLQSRKRSIVEAFIERKLTMEYPDSPDVHLFYAYETVAAEAGGRELYVYYLQDAGAAALYRQLEAADLRPPHMTTPAFLWQRRLKKGIRQFETHGSAFIQKFKTAAFMYFFSKGRFLFSRSIVFSETSDDPSEAVNALTYELSQSIYLYAQRTKSDLRHLLMSSHRADDISDLARNLDREIETWEAATNPVALKTAAPGPIAAFAAAELQMSGDLLTLAHKTHARAREWRPVQVAGMVVGLILLALLGAENFFLIKWTRSNPMPTDSSAIMTGEMPREVIRRYNASLDVLMQEAQRIAAADAIVKLLRALPDAVSLEQLELTTRDNPRVVLKARAAAERMQHLEAAITQLLNNLSADFVGSRQLGKQDVMIRQPPSAAAAGNYMLEVVFTLP